MDAERRGRVFELRQGLGIVALSVASAIAYGIALDQVTARLCVEYFTVGHPNLLNAPVHTANPTVQGLLWGVIATWWFGLGLGLVGALLARVGGPPRVSAGDLVRPIRTMLLCTAGLAVCAGVLGYALTSAGVFTLVRHLAERIPQERHLWFLVAGWMHGASYLGSFIGALVLWGWIVRTRRRTR